MCKYLEPGNIHLLEMSGETFVLISNKNLGRDLIVKSQ